MAQDTARIFMVRPAAFCFNEQTAVSNAFQNAPSAGILLQEKALEEFDGAVAALRAAGVDVWVVEDTPLPVKPDAVFPNNWISTHEDGTIVLYPMHAPNRRLERRADVVDRLKQDFDVRRVIDLSHYEGENRFLEGTGSIVFDHQVQTAYACLSVRTDAGILEELCRALNYTPHLFHATDRKGGAIYHTNVVMGIGEGYAVVCLECVADDEAQGQLAAALEASGKEVIAISYKQMKAFAGNLLSVRSQTGKPFLAVSQTAVDVFMAAQLDRLARHTTLLPLSIPTIEGAGGGSVRCTIAQNFLPVLDKAG